MSTPIAVTPSISTTARPTSSAGAPPKRRRLNFACNYCRSRKSRCDEQKPSCRACLNAGVPCVTIDRRRPGVSITRHEAGTTPSAQTAPAAASPSLPNTNFPGSGSEPAGSSAPQRRPSEAIPLTPRSVSEASQEDGNQRRASCSSMPLARSEPHDAAGDIHAETDHANQTTKFSGLLPILRPSKGSCTLELLTDWLDLAFHRLGIKKRLGPLLTPESSQG
jgi:hypothetical protein